MCKPPQGRGLDKTALASSEYYESKGTVVEGIGNTQDSDIILSMRPWPIMKFMAS